jgi:hypothetical protein
MAPRVGSSLGEIDYARNGKLLPERQMLLAGARSRTVCAKLAEDRTPKAVVGCAARLRAASYCHRRWKITKNLYRLEHNSSKCNGKFGDKGNNRTPGAMARFRLLCPSIKRGARPFCYRNTTGDGTERERFWASCREMDGGKIAGGQARPRGDLRSIAADWARA